MKMPLVVLFVIALGAFVAAPVAKAQLLVDSKEPAGSTGESETATLSQPQLSYVRPTAKIELRNYLFDAFGPYPIVGAAMAAGISQANDTPPEWKQGAEAYGKRVASAFGIAAVTTTTRYTLAKAFGEDTLYYRCQCKGAVPRLRHALISTLTARRGEDGHRVFSLAALVAPYAGTMTAVYAWYPGRYNASDGFRIGNYSLLGYAAGNVALEFVYRGPHSLISRMHLNNGHGAQGSQR